MIGGVLVLAAALAPAPSAASGAPARACVRLTAPLAIGAYPTPAELTPAACGNMPLAALRYDRRSGVVRADRDLKAGDILLGPPASAVAGVTPGQALLLEATVGPVTVQRRLVAVQAARPGQAVFARTEDGHVISIPYPSDEP